MNYFISNKNCFFAFRRCFFNTDTSKGLFRLLTLTVGLFLFWSYSYGQDFIQPNTDNTFHEDGLLYELTYSGNYRDLTVPDGAAGSYLHLKAGAGDGGRIDFSLSTIKGEGKGGEGATTAAWFKIGSSDHEIPAGATIRFVIGGKGESHTNRGQTGYHGAGGGGGTGIIMLPPGIEPLKSRAENWTLLMVAGGGGGGYAKYGSRIRDGYPGNDGRNGTGTARWDLPDTKNITYINTCDNYGGYRYSTAGAGGGSNPHPNIGNGVGAANLNWGGFGGFQSTANGLVQPTGHAGGKATNINCNGGGFGFGSGGTGSNDAAGGGGGYAGGHATLIGDLQYHNKYDPAGGGGSYVNADYALAGTAIKTKHGTTSDPNDGYVLYRFTESDGPLNLQKGFGYTTSQAHYLLKNNGYTLSWQGDGNLVLYNNGNALWASNTAGRGAGLYFQGDGNLVIRDNSGQSIWSSGTPDNWFGGKGGDRVQLSPNGALVMIDVDGKVLKQWH